MIFIKLPYLATRVDTQVAQTIFSSQYLSSHDANASNNHTACHIIISTIALNSSVFNTIHPIAPV